jgi:hypothetical protein
LTADWLMWDAKGRLWWKSGGTGYTRQLAQAGRFTESEALKCQISSDLTSDRHDVAIPLSAVATPDAGWLPIESAPKDGTEILALGYLEGYPQLRAAITHWSEEPILPYCIKQGWTWMSPGYTSSFKPTLWMPLPEVK